VNFWALIKIMHGFLSRCSGIEEEEGGSGVLRIAWIMLFNCGQLFKWEILRFGLGTSPLILDKVGCLVYVLGLFN
jgi:hypothetical protein